MILLSSTCAQVMGTLCLYLNSSSVITQCSIRHLYNLSAHDVPASLKEILIITAKRMERRRCNHHELEEPLTPLECMSSVIDPKSSGTNKNRYVVASQREELRRFCRGLKGVPLIYVKRSVMVMEPMSEGSVGVRESTEREKFRQGIRGRVAGLGKRKREDQDQEELPGLNDAERNAVVGDEEQRPKKNKPRGAKGPNPLSVKKPQAVTKTKTASLDTESRITIPETAVSTLGEANVNILNKGELDNTHPSKRKKKRRRHKHEKEDTLITPEKGENGEEE